MIELTNKNGIFEMALNTKPCNEIGTEMLAELERALQEVPSEHAEALIIYSLCPSGFSAGANLKELYQGMVDRPQDRHASELKSFLDRIHNVMNRLDALPIPTIGVIHGVCFGGGFELALTCDILIAEPTARFCFPELRLGIIPCFGGIPRLKRDLPNSVVRDLLLTGRSVNAKRAQELGLVSQVVSANEGLGVARKMAEQMGKFDRKARSKAKAFIKATPYDELEKEKEIALSLFEAPKVQKELKKFVESEDLRPYLA